MLDRRAFLAVCSRFGLTTTLLPGVLWAMADEKGKITREMIDQASAIADVHINDEYKDTMLDSLNGYRDDYEAIYKLKIPNSVPPAFFFDPIPANWAGTQAKVNRTPAKLSAPNVNAGGVPRNIEDVAFYSVR